MGRSGAAALSRLLHLSPITPWAAAAGYMACGGTAAAAGDLIFVAAAAAAWHLARTTVAAGMSSCSKLLCFLATHGIPPSYGSNETTQINNAVVVAAAANVSDVIWHTLLLPCMPCCLVDVAALAQRL